MNPLFSLLLVLLCEVPPQASSPPEIMPPQLGVAQVESNAGITIRYTEIKRLYEERTLKNPKLVDGEVQEKTVSYTVVRLVPVSSTVKRVAGEFQVFRDGKLIKAPAAAALLKEPTPVVFAEGPIDGSPPHPFFQNYLKDGIITIQIKSPSQNRSVLVPQEVDPFK